jgi:xanthine dehydrogenase accessory factor
MYEIALTVAACLRADTRVDVAWAVETHGFSQRDRSEALAITPGGGRVGTLMMGSLNEQVADLAERKAPGRIVNLHVGDLEAELAGLACGGDARVLLVPAADLPEELWDRLRDREPVCLVTELDGDGVVRTSLYGPETVAEAGEAVAQAFGRGVSDTIVEADKVTTIFWPVPKLVVVGAGSVSEALGRNAELLGWQTQVLGDARAALGVISGLAILDKVVVTSHDVEVAGPALRAALESSVGYIGALGSRRTQQARADWLAYRGVTDLARIHGPAGLDIGANTPAEIAVSIIAEALAVKAQSGVTPLREKTGPIH